MLPSPDKKLAVVVTVTRKEQHLQSVLYCLFFLNLLGNIHRCNQDVTQLIIKLKGSVA